MHFFCLVIGDTRLPEEVRKLTNRAVTLCVQDFIVPAFVDVADVKKKKKRRLAPAFAIQGGRGRYLLLADESCRM